MNNSHRDNLPWQIQRVLVPTLDAIVMVIGLVGHSLVIYILTGYRRKNGLLSFQGTDMLLLALSASDLLLLICLPFHTAAIALGYWPFSRLLCKSISFLGVACSSASVLTLATLAVTRYLIVVHPTWTFRLRMQRWQRFSAILIWVPAIALAAPQFAFRTVRSTPIYCFAFLSNLSQVVYCTILFLFGFALPLIIIVIMYGKLYGFLRRTRMRGAAPQLERYHWQVTQTSVLLVLVFTICWLPSYILMFLLACGVKNIQLDFTVIARLLASSSVISNPMLYAFMSHKFRKKLLVLGRMRCRGCKCVPRGAIVQPFNPVEQDTFPNHADK
ncbi:Galanin-like G-protein coupled receptor npr-9 [Triplophysa tibetana]|uniref:Galanin-like G-protein coupled receptor npr-9 n=1 Tax=Triplophysa tibetana TaxID=1572043 RepID=A0A5A9NCS6_9TELE|nr:Galanin-like G-protein coupled receptor npr-9 [Triplophysa tibetana]